MNPDFVYWAADFLWCRGKSPVGGGLANKKYFKKASVARRLKG
jgi:hypothetical protein